MVMDIYYVKPDMSTPAETTAWFDVKKGWDGEPYGESNIFLISGPRREVKKLNKYEFMVDGTPWWVHSPITGM